MWSWRPFVKSVIGILHVGRMVFNTGGWLINGDFNHGSRVAGYFMLVGGCLILVGLHVCLVCGLTCACTPVCHYKYDTMVYSGIIWYNMVY